MQVAVARHDAGAVGASLVDTLVQLTEPSVVTFQVIQGLVTRINVAGVAVAEPRAAVALRRASGDPALVVFAEILAFAFYRFTAALFQAWNI